MTNTKANETLKQTLNMCRLGKKKIMQQLQYMSENDFHRFRTVQLPKVRNTSPGSVTLLPPLPSPGSTVFVVLGTTSTKCATVNMLRGEDEGQKIWEKPETYIFDSQWKNLQVLNTQVETVSLTNHMSNSSGWRNMWTHVSAPSNCSPEVFRYLPTVLHTHWAHKILVLFHRNLVN